jgi:sucrose phosphorylase
VNQSISKKKQSSGHDALIQTLRDRLRLLYADEQADALAAELAAMALEARVDRPERPDGAMLITYADTIRDTDESPLRTLSRFLMRHVGAGIGTVHLLPFFPSSSDDGFAVIDYRMVDHHFGSWGDIAALAEHYRLMFDLVINHCSRESLWFADFISGREPGRHFFITLQEESDVSQVVRPRSTPLISAVHTYAGIRHVWNTFSTDQVDLDFTNPEVLKAFVDILLFYLAQGAGLIRLDAIAFLWKRLGTSCTSLPETHAVVQVLRGIVDFCAPDVQLVTETNVPHEENVSYFGDGNEAHVVYQFSLAPLLLYSYVFGDASYLTTWAARLTTPPEGCAYLNFIASHDGIGLRPLEGLIPDADIGRLVDAMHERGGFVTLRDAGGGTQKPYEINISLYSAFDEQLAPYLAVHTLLLSFQGIPAIYIHSLLATTNDLDLVEQTGRTRSINRGHWQLTDLERLIGDEDSEQARSLGHFRRILDLRAAQPALQAEGAQHICPSPPGAFLMRRTAPDQELVVAASMLPSPQKVPLPGTGLPQGVFLDVLSGREIEVGDELLLAPYEIVWLDVTQANAADG